MRADDEESLLVDHDGAIASTGDDGGSDSHVAEREGLVDRFTDSGDDLGLVLIGQKDVGFGEESEEGPAVLGGADGGDVQGREDTCLTGGPEDGQEIVLDEIGDEEVGADEEESGGGDEGGIDGVGADVGGSSHGVDVPAVESFDEEDDVL